MSGDVINALISAGATLIGVALTIKYSKTPADRQSAGPGPTTPAPPVVAEPVASRLPPPTSPDPISSQPVEGAGRAAASDRLVLSVSVRAGTIAFFLAIGAAFFWGFGNVVTRWTAGNFSGSAGAISILKYVSAGSVILLVGTVGSQLRGEGVMTTFRIATSGWRLALVPLFAAVVFKAANTYFFIWATEEAPAAHVAALENMHVVWTALFVAIVFSVRLPSGWVSATATVLVGAALLLGFPNLLDPAVAKLPLILGTLSGVSFSIFALLWSTSTRSSEVSIHARAVMTGIFLLLAGLALVPMNFVFYGRPSILDMLQTIPAEHLLAQAMNGVIGIGLTYFLVNEALQMTRKSPRLGALLVSIGLSFAVAFTVVAEAIFLDGEMGPQQLLGVVLYAAGFSAVRISLVRSQSFAS